MALEAAGGLWGHGLEVVEPVEWKPATRRAAALLAEGLDKAFWRGTGSAVARALSCGTGTWFDGGERFQTQLLPWLAWANDTAQLCGGGRR